MPHLCSLAARITVSDRKEAKEEAAKKAVVVESKLHRSSILACPTKPFPHKVTEAVFATAANRIFPWLQTTTGFGRGHGFNYGCCRHNALVGKRDCVQNGKELDWS